jgi:hypothetical protein
MVPAQGSIVHSMTSLDSQIAELKKRRRSMMEFSEWRPSPFYYLYVPLGALLVYFLIGPPWSGLAEQATAPEDRIARSATGSAKWHGRPGRVTHPEPGDLTDNDAAERHYPAGQAWHRP